MDEDIPKSENLMRTEARGYFITAASWSGIYGTSYEIGLREKEGGQKFELLQANWKQKGVLVAARAVALLLDAGFSVNEIKEALTP